MFPEPMVSSEGPASPERMDFMQTFALISFELPVARERLRRIVSYAEASDVADQDSARCQERDSTAIDPVAWEGDMKVYTDATSAVGRGSASGRWRSPRYSKDGKSGVPMSHL
jgi:hypothetical protein